MAATLQVDVLSIFPEMFAALTDFGISRRAHEQGLWHLNAWQLRDFASNAYRTIDDRPYGGGPGMVMLPEPLDAAIAAARARQQALGVVPRVVYLSPQGTVLSHSKVMELAAAPGLILLAGRYEGVDERVLSLNEIEEISLGDYVLSGGELAAMVLLDAVVRQLPGALHDSQSAEQDSFVDGLLDCPHYTRPEVYRGMAVPPVLLSGNHAVISAWRLQQKLLRTQARRPDLWSKRALNKQESRLLGLEPQRSRRIKRPAVEQEQDSAQME